MGGIIYQLPIDNDLSIMTVICVSIINIFMHQHLIYYLELGMIKQHEHDFPSHVSKSCNKTLQHQQNVFAIFLNHAINNYNTIFFTNSVIKHVDLKWFNMLN